MVALLVVAPNVWVVPHDAAISGADPRSAGDQTEPPEPRARLPGALDGPGRRTADPNLSLTAWRSAQIINSLTGREVYRTKGFQSTIQWRAPAVLEQERLP